MRVIYLRKPTVETIDDFLFDQRSQPFSYVSVGMTQGAAPSGYVVDHNRIEIGKGGETFNAAVRELRRWSMYDFPWVNLCWATSPIEEGATVAVLAQALGVWFLNACRIVYVVDEPSGDVQRFGFAYGTLPAHIERGEERFLVEWDRRDDRVWYEILAYSQPQKLISLIGKPVVRRFQKRFARDSMAAMKRTSSRPSSVVGVET